MAQDYSTIRLAITGMHCAGCAARIEKLVRDLPGVSHAAVNLATATGEFKFQPDRISAPDLCQAIARAGFEVRRITAPGSRLARQRAETLTRLAAMRRALWPAFLGALPLLLIAMGPMLGLPLPAWLHPDQAPLAFALVQFILSLPVMYTGWHFYRDGFPALWRRAPNMDSLVALGTGAAWLYSTGNLIVLALHPQACALAHDLYFESAAVLIAMISLGQYLENRARLQTSEAIAGLLRLAPANATRLDAQNQPQTVAVTEIGVGDRLMIKPGERIPVDGCVLEGNSYIDQAMLTGEPLPVPKKPGDILMAGTLNQKGTLIMQAQRVGEQTLLARMINMMEQAQASKAPIASLADRISFYFVPAVIAVALLAGLSWYLLGQASFSFALRIFITVLVIACPCAMGLATPTAVMVAVGRGAQLGVLVKSGAALQQLASINTVVFDKTGTLTHGQPTVTDIHQRAESDFTSHDLLQLAASLESHSEHPLAQAVLEAARAQGIPLLPASEVRILPGAGLQGRVQEHHVLIGNQTCLEQHGINLPAESVAQEYCQTGKTPLYLAVDQQWEGLLAVADQLKAEAPQVVTCLTSMGMRVAMLTGDNPSTAQAIARQAGITEITAAVLPDRKASVIEELQQKGACVAMVGDGINDAVALAQADVGIAMGSGIDIAVEAGEVVLVQPNLQGVPLALALGRASLRIIKQNLFWAFAFNTLGIPLAAGVLHLWGGPTLNPMFAGSAMALSSVMVVSNALRLRFFTPPNSS